MNIIEVLKANIKVLVAIVLVIILLPVGYSVVLALSPGVPQPFLEMPHAKYTKCVLDKDAAYMRHYHMDLLKELMSDVVREGKDAEYGLQDCWKCHTSRTRFCNRCHDAVGLDPRCFKCHYGPE
ncbi:MAG: hypothetical protein ACYS47_12420 [Planctomycetota bacterium]|jgi:hypothetical protein